MTYIEFFDEVASRNISTCLTYAPDRATDMGNYVLEGIWKMSDAQLSKNSALFGWTKAYNNG